MTGTQPEQQGYDNVFSYFPELLRDFSFYQQLKTSAFNSAVTSANTEQVLLF